MSHTRWESVSPLPDPRALEIQMAYVDGYILALEDTLDDLSDTRARWLAAWDNASVQLPPDVVARIHQYVDKIFKDARKGVGNTLQAAKETRKTFKEVAHGKND